MVNITNYFLLFNNLDFYLIGKLDEAIENLTKAIMLNPTSAIMYATRGGLLCPFLSCCLDFLTL